MKTARFKKIFHALEYAGTQGVKEEDAVARIVMVNRLSLAFGVVILIIAPVMLYYLKSPASIAVAITAEFIINCGVIWLNHRQRHTAAALVLYFLQCIAIVYFGFLLGKLLQLQFTIVFLLSIIYLIFREANLRRIAFVSALVVLGLLEASYYFNDADSVIPISYNTAYTIHLLVVLAVLYIIIVVSKPYIRSNDINAALKRANDFKRVFVYQVIHEMRTPLNAIFGVAQLLKKEVRRDPALKSVEGLTDQLLAASNNARSIVNDVMDMALIESGQMETIHDNVFHLQPFFANTVELNRVVALSRQMKIHLRIDDMPPIIHGDSLKLIQITTNLLANAIKYGEKGSTIELRIHGLGDTWQLAVSNSGANISPEKLATIFDPFVTDKHNKQTEGTGLGLYIVKNKVEAMGGSVGAASPAGGDTVFTVTLPLRAGTVDEIPEEEKTPEITDLHEAEVYIAEDNELSATLLSRLLRQTGCRVTVAVNGLELLQQVEKKQPDIIILDYHMDVMNGEETLQYLKEDPMLRHIPVIVATGDAFIESREALEAAGADAFIEKPIDHKRLLQLLQKHLHRSNEELKE
ncbi:ATP-binding response regulator [Chitinophaga lutea]